MKSRVVWGNAVEEESEGVGEERRVAFPMGEGVGEKGIGEAGRSASLLGEGVAIERVGEAGKGASGFWGGAAGSDWQATTSNRMPDSNRVILREAAA